MAQAPTPTATEGWTSRLGTWLVWLLLLIMLAGFGSAAWRARFVMDEFGLLQGAGFLMKSPLYQGVDPIKTVLATSLYARVDHFGSSVAMMHAARMLGLAAAGLSILLLVQASRVLWPRANRTPVAAVMVLAFSNFFERAFRIRTDTLALPFALGAFLLLVRPTRLPWHTALAGLLLGGSFLCTQKAIYFLGAFTVALLVARISIHDRWAALHDFALLVSGWGAAFLAYAVWFGGWRWWTVVTQVLLGPRYIFSGTGTYSGLNEFVTQTLQRNLVPYGLCAIGMAIALRNWRRIDCAQRFAAVASILVTTLIFTHNQPWPYVFVWAQAFLAIWVVQLVDTGTALRWPLGRFAILAVGLLAVLSIPRQVRFQSHTNQMQLAVMSEAERLLEPNSRYFDGIGMVVNRRIAGPYPYWSWEVPNLNRMIAALRRGDDSLPRAIVDDHPKLWILNYRIDAVAELSNRMISGGYVRISPLILLAGIEWRPGIEQAVFICRWPGRYQLFDDQGQPVQEAFAVDGGSECIMTEIKAGVHQLERKPGTGLRFLLPVGTVITDPLTYIGPTPDLYSEVYSY